MIDKDLFIRENYKNMTNDKLAECIGCSRATIIRDLKRLGLTRRVEFKLEVDEYLSDIPNFSSYSISNFGKVLKKKDNTLIKESYTTDGYASIKLVDDKGKRTTIRLNRLVASVFIHNDNPNIKIEVNHKDGNKKNNRATNLEWSTPSDNQKHAYRNNLRESMKGSKNPSSNYTEEQVREVCELLERGHSTKTIMSICNFVKSDGFVNNIKNKKTWKHISVKYNF